MTVYALPFVLVLGVWTHELVHAITARFLGADVKEINLRDLYVDFSTRSKINEQIIIHSPFLIGCLTLPLVLFLYDRFDAAWLALVYWAAMTLTGGDGEFGIY